MTQNVTFSIMFVTRKKRFCDMIYGVKICDAVIFFVTKFLSRLFM